MVKSFTLLLLLFCCTHSFAQQHKKFSYLVVQFDSHKDHNNSRTYFTIEPESSTFLEMHPLADYNPRSNKGNNSAFFFSRNDSAATVYNYFRSVSEALLFLGENGWELVSVNNSLQSEAATHHRLFDKEQAYTKIKAKPVFYFKKPVDH